MKPVEFDEILSGISIVEKVAGALLKKKRDEAMEELLQRRSRIINEIDRAIIERRPYPVLHRDLLLIHSQILHLGEQTEPDS